MVSLYRAWAAWRDMGVPSAPDALIQVGGVRFTAHARLLAAHSGYFKSVLSRSWPANPASEESKEDERYETQYERERRELETRYQGTEESVVHVPNISAHQFWPLLAYMYTGYLELTTDNIYQVLLATHLLHMPRALEICRNFLSQGSNTSPTTLPTTVVKPIPSRKLPTFLPNPIPYRPFYPDPPIQYFNKPHETPFRPVESLACNSGTSVIEATPNVGNSPETTEETGKQENTTLSVLHRKPDREVISTYDEHEGLEENKIETLNVVNLAKTKKGHKVVSKKLKLVNKKEESAESPDNVVTLRKSESRLPTASDNDKVVVDVACCDGPVRFHRVLNKAYKNTETDTAQDDGESSDTDDSYVEVEEDSRSNHDAPYDNCNAFSKSLQKQMSENIRNMTNKHNENNPGFDSQGKIEGLDEASNSLLSNKSQETIYTCVYCNHTFKSQYCYQKHARRHINPVSIDAVNQGTIEFTPDDCCKTTKIGIKVNAATSGPKREVRLLDMNVQYYPCKTCGSKFPSYYFVHKHRKMCHADELEGSVELGSRSNSDQDSGHVEKKLKSSGSVTSEVVVGHNDMDKQTSLG